MMNNASMGTVSKLAAEVIDLCEQVKKEKADTDRRYPQYVGCYTWQSKTTAALRRRSMDLTRALADLRKSR